MFFFGIVTLLIKSIVKSDELWKWTLIVPILSPDKTGASRYELARIAISILSISEFLIAIYS